MGKDKGLRPQLLCAAASRLGWNASRLEDAKVSSIPIFASWRLCARPPSLRADAPPAG